MGPGWRHCAMVPDACAWQHVSDHLWCVPGETIPASDSEDEERQAEGELEGAGRERSEWVMRRLAQEAGAGPDVVSVLAKRFGASKGPPPSFCSPDSACVVLPVKQLLPRGEGAGVRSGRPCSHRSSSHGSGLV